MLRGGTILGSHGPTLTMRAIRVLSAALAFALLGASAPALASRPVYHTLTLTELIGESDMIVIARKAEPFIVTRQWSVGIGPSGEPVPPFPASAYRFQASEMLYAKAGHRIRADQIIEVAPSGQQVRFAEYRGRKLFGRTMSYAARRYEPSAPEAFDRDAELILFLSSDGGRLEFTAERAWEPVAQKSAILKLLRPRQSCLKHDASGECLVRCNIWDSQGRCQHACTKGLPCD